MWPPRGILPGKRRAVDFLALTPIGKQQGPFSTERGGRIAATQSEVIFPRPTPMFSDHDNLTNAAAAAPAPEAESAPNSAHTETNTTVEGKAEQTAPAATEHAEAVNSSKETPSAPESQQAAPVAE